MMHGISRILDKFDFRKSIKRKLLVIFLILIILPIVIISYSAFDSGRTSTENRVMAHLTSVADMKKSEIESWLMEKVIESRTLAETLLIQEYLTALDLGLSIGNQTSENEAIFNKVQYTLQNWKHNFGYHQVILVDSSLIAVSSTNAENLGKLLDAKQNWYPRYTKEAYIEDIAISPDGKPLMVFSSPIFGFPNDNIDEDREVIGILVIEIAMEGRL